MAWNAPLKATRYAKKTLRFYHQNSNDANHYLIATPTIMRNALEACFNQDSGHVAGQLRMMNFKVDLKILEALKVDFNEYDNFAPIFRKSDLIDDGRLLSHKSNIPEFLETFPIPRRA